MDGARCVHIERHSTAPILPSYRRTSWVRLPRAAHMTHVPRTRVLRCTFLHHHGTHPKAQVRLAAAGCLHTAVALELSAGQMWAAGMTVGCWPGRARRTGLQLEEYTSRFRYKQTDSDATSSGGDRAPRPWLLLARWTGYLPRAGLPSRPGTGSRQPTTPTAKWTPLLTRARQPAPRAGPAGRTSRAEGRNPIGPGAGRQSSTARQPRPHVPRGPTRLQGSSVGLGQGLTAHRWARLGIGGTRPTPGPITPITDSDWTYQWADGLTAHASGIAHRY